MQYITKEQFSVVVMNFKENENYHLVTPLTFQLFCKAYELSNIFAQFAEIFLIHFIWDQLIVWKFVGMSLPPEGTLCVLGTGDMPLGKISMFKI